MISNFLAYILSIGFRGFLAIAEFLMEIGWKAVCKFEERESRKK
jgi:hypothetical protein